MKLNFASWILLSMDWLFPFFYLQNKPVHLKKLILHLFVHLFPLKHITSHTCICFFHVSTPSLLSRSLKFILWKPALLCPPLPVWWPATGTGRSWQLPQNAHHAEGTTSFPGVREHWLSLPCLHFNLPFSSGHVKPMGWPSQSDNAF